MRRRRNAASEEIASGESLETAAQSPVVNTEPASAEPTTEPKPARRRTSRKTTTGETVAEPSPETPAAPIAESPVSSGEELTPARARRARRRSGATDEAGTEIAADNTVAPEKPARRRGRGAIGNVAGTEPNDAPSGSAETAVSIPEPTSNEALVGEPETPKRRSRRRAAPAEPTPETTVAETTSSEDVVADTAEPTSEPKTSGRSRRRRGSRGTTDTQPDTAEPTAIEAEEAPSEGRSRTRGLRRTRTVAAPQLMVSGEDQTTPVDSSAEPEASDETASVSRRTRGGRRARPVVETEPAPPPEPVRPAYVPLPQEVLNRLPESLVRKESGRVVLRVDDAAFLPVAFFVNTEANPDDRSISEREIRLAYQKGVRLFTFLAHLPWPAKDGGRRTDALDSILEFVAANAPDAKLIPRLMFAPPPSWIRRHSDDMAVHENGPTEDVSMASRAFWEDDADAALRAAVEHVAQGPHAQRVVGFYLERAEWFFDRDGGYDRSKCNQVGFRRWLRQRYKGSVVALRAAWHDGGVTFDNADVPGWPPPAGYPDGVAQFFGPREQRWTDYHEYASHSIASVILGLAKAVKEASGRRSLVAVSYGYTLELPRAHSGHLALGTILDSPDVDILTGPVSYSGRQPGGSAPQPSPIDSVALAGKLWITEDDTKTHLSSDETSDPFNVRVPTESGTQAVHLRNFGAALAKGTGISWMDLWGEGWLDNRETWEFLGGLREVMETYVASPDRSQAPDGPDVAVLVDEKSFFGVRNDELLQRMVADQRDALARSGARYGIYLQSDLAKPDFPSSPRLLLFLNPFHIEPSVRTALRERFQDDGRTLAWVYAPGILDGSVSEVAELVGMHLKLQPWGSRVGTVVRAGTRSRLTERLPEPRFGADRRCDPSVCVVDPRAEILGEYPSGTTSLAHRKHARWQSVFIGDPGLSIALLRGLYRLAGVPVYTVEDDACWIGDGIACFHSDPGGGTRIMLPSDAALYDVGYDETLASGGRGARFTIPPHGTRLLAFGDPDSLRRDYEVDCSLGAPGFDTAEVPEIVPFVFDDSVAVAERVNPESDARLFAETVARMTSTEPETEAPSTEEEGAAGRSSRRRRRRRGRGGDGSDLPAEVGDTLEPTAGGVEERSRPTLEELLPAAVDVPEGDLPPVPEELLPIDEASLGENKPARRRRRRGRNGRGAAGDGEEVTSDNPPEPESPSED